MKTCTKKTSIFPCNIHLHRGSYFIILLLSLSLSLKSQFPENYYTYMIPEREPSFYSEKITAVGPSVVHPWLIQKSLASSYAAYYSGNYRQAFQYLSDAE